MLKWFRRRKEETVGEPPSSASPELVHGEEHTNAITEEPPERLKKKQELPPSTLDANEHLGSREPRVEANTDLSPQYQKPVESSGLDVALENVENVPANPLLGASRYGEDALVASDLPEKKKGFFDRLKDRLSKTKTSMVDRVRSAIRLFGKVDEDLLEEIETILIQSDVGMPTTRKIVDRMRDDAKKEGADTPEALLALFKRSIEEILKSNARRLNYSAGRPTIILVIGVNGTGKTTTIGKMAKQLSDQGKRVMMVAADTFRAAAIEQLTIWAERTGSAICRQEQGADPAAVVYEALEGVRQDAPDVILIDTAGRLHTKVNLMEELKKIVRVIQKHYTDAPHETILVLDATTGQNAVNQVKLFHDAANLTGLVMTKLDGTAKGGILIACKDIYDLPILKIGIGEGAEDLRDFDPHEFVEALFSEGNGEN